MNQSIKVIGSTFTILAALGAVYLTTQRDNMLTVEPLPILDTSVSESNWNELDNLTIYELNEYLTSYYHEWRNLKFDMTFSCLEEEDQDTFNKIREIKQKYRYAKKLIRIKGE